MRIASSGWPWTRLNCTCEARLLPLGFERGQFLFRQSFFLVRNLIRDAVQVVFLRGRWKRQHRLGVARSAVESFFRDGVEEREELVKLFLFDGIVFMIVA